MRMMMLIAVVVLAGSTAFAQAPTQAEIDQWKKDPAAQILETSPCKMISWLVDSERKNNTHEMTDSLGWWGRGWIEGATYILGRTATEKANAFGISAIEVAAHLQTYCAAHPTETPNAGIRDLMLKAMK